MKLLNTGWQQFPIDLSTLESGMYNIRINSEKYIIHKKLLLIK